MSDEVWKRDEVESPCIKLCVIDEASGLCLGCRRSMQEIAAWGSLLPEERMRVIDALPGRVVPSPKRRGGRRSRAGERGKT